MKLFSTSCDTQFLGWDAPLLPSSAEFLGDRYAADGRLDLRNLILVLPSSRAGRRMSKCLQDLAQARSFRFESPEIITLGELPEHLYRPPAPVAIEFEQTLAWVRVLRSFDPQDLRPLIPVIPPAGTISAWMELAGTLRRVHEELSSNRLTFKDVMDVTQTDSEKRRWQRLCEIFAGYLDELKQAGLADPHWARREAVRLDQCRCDRTIVLIGASDLSDLLIGMLRSLDAPLVSLVAAPLNSAGRFDEFGCVDTRSWINHSLPIEDDHLIAAGDVSDQTLAVAETVQMFSEQSTASMTVGVTDESHVGPIELQLHGSGQTTHRELGWSIAQTSVGRLLELTSTHLARQTWQSLAALVRHAEVYRMISAQFESSDDAVDWLTDVDELLANHYPVQVADELPPEAIEHHPAAQRVAAMITQWLAGFDAGEQAFAEWSERIEQWLTVLYGESPSCAGSGQNNRTALAYQATQRVVQRFGQLRERLDFRVDGATAIEMLGNRLSDVRVVKQAAADEIPIVGWLDLALDDADALVVNGLNHPFVPGAITSDPFLPGSVRTKLRMADNDRRFARDVYALHVMLCSRPSTRLIVGRIAADGSPTPPSRLLAAAPTADVARRVRQLLSESRPSQPVHHHWDQVATAGETPENKTSASKAADRVGLPIPLLPKADPVTALSVTAFRDYLICPYRFYLRHVLKLRPLDDAMGELAANQFGDLIHGALERFGLSEDRNESNAAKLESMLLAHLHEYAAANYGGSVSSAVTLQIAQAERRLKAVARVQASRAGAGWSIHAAEASVGEDAGAGVEVDGHRIGLRGRFDRIDYHAETGRWAILDYKTHGHPPEAKHLRRTDDGIEWIDLQLPLYRMMSPFLGIDTDPAEIELGYFNISEKDEETRINVADFSEEQLQQASELIRECVRRIASGDFRATSDRVQFDDFGMILQTGVASRLLDQADQWLGEEAGV